MTAFADDQHQRVGRPEAAIAEWPDLGVDPGDIGAEVERWQQLGDGLRQFRPAGLQQLFAVDDVDGVGLSATVRCCPRRPVEITEMVSSRVSCCSAACTGSVGSTRQATNAVSPDRR